MILIPSARFLERKANRAPWVWGSLLIARIGYGLVAVLPWLFRSRLDAALVWLLIAISVPATFFSAGFNPMLADVVPERDRARVFANRSIIVSAAVALLTFLAGRWLEAGPAPRLGRVSTQLPVDLCRRIYWRHGQFGLSTPDQGPRKQGDPAR